MRLPRVGLVGASGYGRVHLEHLLDFHARGRLRLVAAVVIDHAAQPDACARLREAGCVVVGTWAEFAARVCDFDLDLAVVPTPIHLHAAMASELLHAGVNVLIEKPLAATVADGAKVAAAARATGRMAAIGFQYLHAGEVQALKARLVRGEAGRLRRIAVHAAWPRSHSYYTRNDWAGRLRTAQGWVLDSPVANAMAHFFVQLFYLAGDTLEGTARARRITAELYRAQAIESFDTAVVRVETTGGCLLEFYGTHSSRRLARPTLVIEAEHGRGEWTQDREVRLVTPAGEWHETAEPEPRTRERMLDDVLARLRGEPRFICGPELALEHVRCVNALHEYAPIHAVPAGAIGTRRENGETYSCVPALDDALARAFREHTTLREAGLAWAAAPAAIDVSDYPGLRATATTAAPHMNG